MTKSFRLAAALLLGVAMPAGAQTGVDLTPRPADTPAPYVQVRHPEWTRDAVLYQLNTRQFTPEGTFAAAQKQLPRLKALGVDIIWLMPIHPIGEKNRKGPLGSPYSIKDYFGVNPEFGTMADFKALVDAAHAQGMYVILDWVANHSAWDNPIVAQHPDWYDRDWKGDFRPTPWFDWSDIIDFDYSKPAMRRYMTEALKFWVREAGVDGYRADVAGAVPVQFWENARAELDRIKPVFMLAEWEYPELHRKAFDATYAWKLTEAMHNVAQGKADTNALAGYFSWHESAWPREAYKMAYTSNHDTNSWEGTDQEVYGPALPAMIALTFAADTMPLIYNGQEAGNPKRLKFFERDPIAWHDHPNGALFKKLIAFKKANPALANGQFGAPMIKVENSVPAKIFSFVRQRGGSKVLALFNFSAEPQTVGFTDRLPVGRYVDFADGKPVSIAQDSKLTMAPWSYRLLSKR
jgi:glycosidase